MVGHAGSPTRIVHVQVTFIRSTVKVKVTDLLKFRKSGRRYNLVIVIAGRPQQAVHAGGGDDRQPLAGLFLFLWCHLSVETARGRRPRFTESPSYATVQQ